MRKRELRVEFTHVAEKAKVAMPEGREHFQAGVVGQKSRKSVFQEGE